MKKVSLLLVVLACLLVSCKPEIENPTVVTKSVEEITENSAKVIGQVTADGGAEVTERGVCWNTEGNPQTIDYRVKAAEGGLGTYELVAANLNPNTTYYVRAYAINEAGVSYGDDKTFTTLKEKKLPTVTTRKIEDITSESAESGGEVTDDGNSEITARGVCWSRSKNPTIDDDKTTDGTGTGSFTSDLTDLKPDTKYYVRAYATNEVGTNYGEEISFITAEEAEPAQVTTKDVTDVTATTAVGGGEVTDDGNGEVTARGVCWSTSQNPTIDDNKTVDGAGTGAFTSQLGDLEPNTTYYVRAYATNEAGTAYGEELSFTTLEEIRIATVLTADITDITHNSAVSGGEVTDDGNGEVTARGVCWSTSQNPTTDDNKTVDGAGAGSFTSQLGDLEPQTTYYVRAYATNAAGTAYGSQYVFETEEKTTTGTINGYEYVDLGLSVKWATCNVGATKPEEYGNYYAWGETATKSDYSSSTSLTYGLSKSELQAQGIIDENGSLTPSHDAATANWGGTWRIPTEYEQRELLNNCTWEWTTRNGVNGYEVTGPNGNSIFLPAAGYRRWTSLYNDGGVGFYWSSTPYGSLDDYACYLYFSSDGQGMGYGLNRYDGRSVRPISE